MRGLRGWGSFSWTLSVVLVDPFVVLVDPFRLNGFALVDPFCAVIHRRKTWQAIGRLNAAVCVHGSAVLVMGADDA